jgi:signal transduction histidine kinase
VDVTDRRQAERTRRLASVGTLASGVAHEINSPLAVVLSNLGYLVDEIADMGGRFDAERTGDLRAAADEARACAERVRRTVQELRRMADPAGVSAERFDPVESLRGALGLIEPGIGGRATLLTEVRSVPSVEGSPEALLQALVSVLVNAMEAVADVPREAARVRVSIWTSVEGWATIEVSDTGRGIPAEDLPRIFDPFFSTKAAPTGVGLGLAVAHRTVRHMGGTIDVTSRPGGGTAVWISLPPAPTEPHPRTGSAKPGATPPPA